MNILEVIGIVGAGVIILLVFIRMWINDIQEKSKPSDELIKWLQDMGRRIDSSTQNVDQKLTQNMQQFNDRLDHAARVISQVQKNIGEFSEIGRSMKDLQQFLQSPKLRGTIGEQILNDLLAQFLPAESYSLQYGFKNGERCDAIIKTSQGILPVDAKFPLENFRKILNEESKVERDRFQKEFIRDVKKHIDDIARKYISVDEGTLDYALMYVPSETIYYEVIKNGDLYDFAAEKRILIVSPMSFFAYLKVILMSFEGQKIEKRAKEILHLIQALQKDYEKTDDALSVLNRHVTNAYNQMNNVSKNFITFGQRLHSSKMIEQKKEAKDELEELPM